MMDPISKFVADYVVGVTAQMVMPLMLLCFVGGIFSRLLIYYIARSEERFVKELEKRALFYFGSPEMPRVASFSRLLRILLMKTFNECYNFRARFLRRNMDYVTSLWDRLFLVEEGVIRLVQDSVKEVRYLRREGYAPKMLDITRRLFENNPFFNRLFGIFSVGRLNDMLNILPGLFIIGGIFGTFLGISKSLPELGNMDLNNMQETKQIMDMFLVNISVAMIKSIVGIGFSVVMSLINTLFAVESIYYSLVNRYSGVLEQLWNETTTNEIDREELFPNQPQQVDKRAA